MATVEVEGCALAYDDVGAGAAVVLLHAGIADRRMWRHQAAELRGHRRVLAVDLPGYGESTVPTGAYANHDAVAGLLDELDIPQASLVGCSFGGKVAIDTALAHPDRVNALAYSPDGTKLASADIADDDLEAVTAAEIDLWVVGPDREPGELDPQLLAFATEMDRQALAAETALDAVPVRELHPPAIGRLGEIRIPTLVAVGAADVPEIRHLADVLAAQVPDARRLPDVPDAAHLLPLECSDPVNAALLAFLP